MNTKRIAHIAALAAFVLGAHAADAATATSAASPVIIKFKTVATASVVVYADYELSDGKTSPSAGTIVLGTQTAPTGGGTCGTAGASTGNTLDFGTITPDSAIAISCLYEKGVDAVVTTNSTNWTLTQYLSAAPGANFTLCTYPAATVATALPLTYTAPAANTIGNTCAAAQTLGTSVPGIAFHSGTNAGVSYATEDVGLLVAANANVVTQSGITLTLQLVAN